MPSRLKLRPRSTPPTPPTDAETLFLDEADGALKSIDSDGVVTAIGAGGGAAEPGTLAEVLAQGNNTDGIPIVGADDGSSLGAALNTGAASGDAGGTAGLDGGVSAVGHGGAGLSLPGGGAANGGKAIMFGGAGLSGDSGGQLQLAGGDDSTADSYIQGRNGAAGRPGSLAYVQGGTGDNGAKFGGYFDAMPGTASAHGKVQIGTDNTTGAQGQLLTAEGDLTSNAVWQSLVTSQAGTPVGGPYITPLVFDSTATTGGLYFWTGADYAQIGLATS